MKVDRLPKKNNEMDTTGKQEKTNTKNNKNKIENW